MSTQVSKAEAVERPAAAACVSVVIPAYNAAAHLAQCLESVRVQRGDFTLDTLVIDDGSRDDTVAIARGQAGVRVITQANRGPSAARNAGIAATTGEFIAFLDADDLWPVGKLDAQLDVLTRHPDVALVFGDCRQFDAAGSFTRTEFESGGFGAASWGPGPIVPRAYARLLANNFITTGSVVVRRSALLAAGGFAEDLRLVEDLDLWLRIAHGRPIAWCGHECLQRRRHEHNTSRDAEAIGLAFLEVLRRHRQALQSGDAAEPGIDMRQLVSREYLHLAELAMCKRSLGVAWQRVWHALCGDLRPANQLHVAKAAAKLVASSLGWRG